MEVLIGGAAVLFAVLTIGVAALSIAAPVFWIWMLIDAAMRDESDYPGGGQYTRLIWVLLIGFVQVSCVLYYFLVYVPAQRGVAERTYTAGTTAA